MKIRMDEDFNLSTRKQILNSATEEQKSYVSNAVDRFEPGIDMNDLDDDDDEAWEYYTDRYSSELSEYKKWKFIDAVEDGIFTDDEEKLFNDLWDIYSHESYAGYI